MTSKNIKYTQFNVCIFFVDLHIYTFMYVCLSHIIYIIHFNVYCTDCIIFYVGHIEKHLKKSYIYILYMYIKKQTCMQYAINIQREFLQQNDTLETYPHKGNIKHIQENLHIY